MKKVFTVCIALLIALVFITGCQPTPEKPAVVQKNDLDKHLVQTASPDSSGVVSDTWQETLEQDGVKVVIDAAVEIPDVASWPVVEVTPYGFTEQDAQTLVDVFMQGKPIYEANHVRTKADIERDIIWANEQLEKAKTDETLSVDGLNYQLEQYQTEYDNAPDKAPERKKGILEFKRDPDPSAEVNRSIDVEADLEDSSSAYAFAGVSDDNQYSTLDFGIKYDHPTNYYPINEIPDTIPGMTVSYEEALQTAQSAIAKMGLKDVQLAYAQLGADVEAISGLDFSGVISDPEKSKCFIFHFERTIGGAPVTYTNYTGGVMFDDNGEKYERVWSPEIIEIAVGDNGVFWFRWHHPGVTGKTVNANVQIKDFGEIKETFKKQLFYQKAWSVPSETTEITIKRVVLGLMRVKMKEGQYVYLPVWDFIGDWTDDPDAKNVSMLTLNAIDGSVIDRGLGY